MANRSFIARALDIGMLDAQIALACRPARPRVTAPKAGASKLAHLDDAVAALAMCPDAEETALLEAPYQPRAILGSS